MLYYKKIIFILLLIGVELSANSNMHQNIDDAFYEKYAKDVKPIMVKDTDSAMGRYNLYAKELNLKTLVRAHGHLCDGLVIAYVELSNTLPKLFDDGVVDRTDLRVVAKNSPCLVDTSALMSGARINHKTLSLDNSLGVSFIVQKISTKQTYKVSLKDTRFLKALKTKEKEIKSKLKHGKEVNPKDIDEVESLAFDVIKYMLNTKASKLLKIEKLKNYKFKFNIDDIGTRSDIINKNVGR